MRLAGTLFIALAALVQLNGTAWSQQSSNTSLAPQGPQPQPLAGAPSLTPPEEIEGAWVDDPGHSVAPAPQNAVPMPIQPGMAQPFAPPMYYDEYAEKAAYMYGGYPEEYAGTDFSGDPYAGYGGGEGGGGCESGECCGGCQHGEHCGHCGCCCNDGPCGYLWNEVHSHRRFYLREEYLIWKGKGNPLPPLVTTSPVGVPQDEAGVLGVPDTEILFGDQRVNTNWRNGGRITAGMWLVDGEFLGVEGHYMGFEQSDRNFFAEGEFSQGGNGPILARPFTNVEQNGNDVTETPDSSLLAFPDFVNSDDDIVDLDGQISITSKVATQSAGAVLRKLMWIEFHQNWRLDGIAGYRFFRLDDGIRIHDFWTETGGQLGTASFTSYDYFQARNEFHGGEIGLVGSVYRGPWSLELLGKVALGNNHQTVKIDGTSFVSSGGGAFVETNNYRLLTQPTNDGVYKRNVFAVLPETAINLRLDICCNVRLLAGYSFLYLSQAQRSGKAIDLRVNESQIGGALVGPAVPDFKFKNDNGYWMHGFNAGVEIRW